LAFSVQGRPEKVRQVKSKAKSKVIIFFYFRGIIHKQFDLAGQAESSAYYCDCVRM
jgi:hypothetical protein